jgi:hypothetical protein
MKLFEKFCTLEFLVHLTVKALTVFFVLAPSLF